MPLADLRLKFGMEQTPPTIDTRIVVIEVEIDGDIATVGIRADKVYEITEVAASALEETPRIGMRWRPEFIHCIGKRGDDFIVVLDIGRIFSGTDVKEKIVVFQSFTVAPERSLKDKIVRITIKLKLGFAFAAIIALSAATSWLGINSLGALNRTMQDDGGGSRGAHADCPGDVQWPSTGCAGREKSDFAEHSRPDR